MPKYRLAMRDIADGQLETADGRRIGRVADLEAEWRPDGTLKVTHLLVGPLALVGRIGSSLRPIARRLVGDRFDHRIPIAEVVELGPTIKLRGPAAAYDVGTADAWVVNHILRFIPGNGR